MEQLSRLRGLGRLESRLCVMWFHVDTIIRYSAKLFIRVLSIRTSLRVGGTTARPHHVHHPASLVPKNSLVSLKDLGSEVVFWFDEWFIAFGNNCWVFFYVHVLSPFAVPLRSYSTILSFWCSLIWFDAGHVPDHSPLPVLFCSYYAFWHSSCLIFLTTDGVLGTLLWVSSWWLSCLHTAENSDFVYSSTACFAMCFWQCSRTHLFFVQQVATRPALWDRLIAIPLVVLCSTASQPPSHWRRGSLQLKVSMKERLVLQPITQ